MKRTQRLVEMLFESDIGIHVIFIVCFLVFFDLPGLLNDLSREKLVKVFVYAVFILFCIYSGRWCSRRFLAKSLFKLFFLFSPALVLLLFWIGFFGLRVLTSNRVESIFFIVFTVVGISFAAGVFLSTTRSALMRQIVESKIREEQMHSELRLLQSQVSPHFLFNTLNNLYGISLSRHESLPGLLLKLSELLRYSLYETGERFIPLKQEIAYISNYMEFERLRASDRLMLETKITAADDQILIAPMVFIVFVENAFKHAGNTLGGRINISVSLSANIDRVAFSISNSYDLSAAQNQDLLAHSGIGISNTIKRLDILYGKDYTLNRAIKDEKYVVDLILKSCSA